MATRKKNKKTPKPQYVKTKSVARKKSTSSVLVRRGVTLLMLVLVLCGLGYGLYEGFSFVGEKLYSENPAFEIHRLIITSDGRLKESRIRSFIGVSEGDNLFSVNFEDIENKLAKVADIESVYIERKLPHTLVVKVKERAPVARIVGKHKMRYPFVVDRFGYVLPPRQSATGLPIISGLDQDLRPGLPAGHPKDENVKDVKTALQILSICESTDYLRRYIRISSMDLKYSDFIDMRLEDGSRVRMPRFALNKKLQNLASAIKVAQDRGERYKEWDLTLDSPNIPAMRY